MTVYLVTDDDAYYFNLYRVFSTPELAHAWIDRQKANGCREVFMVEPWAVDDQTDEVIR